MISGPPASRKIGFNLTADGKEIQPQDSLYILGVTLQNNGKWNKSINQLVSQLSCCIQALHSLSKIASKSTLTKILKSLIQGKINYGIQVFGHLPDYLANKIQKMILQSARMILGSRTFRYSTSCLLTETSWPSYRQQEFYMTAKLGAQSLATGLPLALASIIPPLSIQVTRSQQADILPLPNWFGLTASDSYRVRIIKYLNSLPPAVRQPGIPLTCLKRIIREHAHTIISPYISPANLIIPHHNPNKVIHHYSPTIPHYSLPPPGPVAVHPSVSQEDPPPDTLPARQHIVNLLPAVNPSNHSHLAVSPVEAPTSTVIPFPDQSLTQPMTIISMSTVMPISAHSATSPSQSSPVIQSP